MSQNKSPDSQGINNIDDCMEELERLRNLLKEKDNQLGDLIEDNTCMCEAAIESNKRLTELDNKVRQLDRDTQIMEEGMRESIDLIEDIGQVARENEELKERVNSMRTSALQETSDDLKKQLEDCMNSKRLCEEMNQTLKNALNESGIDPNTLDKPTSKPQETESKTPVLLGDHPCETLDEPCHDDTCPDDVCLVIRHLGPDGQPLDDKYGPGGRFGDDDGKGGRGGVGDDGTGGQGGKYGDGTGGASGAGGTGGKDGKGGKGGKGGIDGDDDGKGGKGGKGGKDGDGMGGEDGDDDGQGGKAGDGGGMGGKGGDDDGKDGKGGKGRQSEKDRLTMQGAKSISGKDGAGNADGTDGGERPSTAGKGSRAGSKSGERPSKSDGPSTSKDKGGAAGSKGKKGDKDSKTEEHFEEFVKNTMKTLSAGEIDGCGLERELRKILDMFIDECGFCFCKCNIPKSRFYAICHRLYHLGLHTLDFRDLVYMHKRIFAAAENILPGCLFNIIMKDMLSGSPLVPVGPALEAPEQASIQPANQQCCNCKSSLCCSDTDEKLMMKGKFCVFIIVH